VSRCQGSYHMSRTGGQKFLPRCNAAAALSPAALPWCCPQVVLAASQLLGALSPLRLPSIAKRWELELNKLIRADSNSPTRQVGEPVGSD